MKKVDIGTLASTDFDALLKEARAQHDKYRDETANVTLGVEYNVDTLSWPPAVQASLKAAYNRWLEWEQENVLDKGLKLFTNIMGSPIAVTGVLAVDETVFNDS